MATKTISVDLEAYERLKSVKLEHESFSEVIKRLIHEPISLDEWAGKFERAPLSDEFVTAVEDQVASRRHRRNVGRR